jgi:GLPGLI family protein
MNNFLIRLTIVITAFISSIVSAQEFQGQAFYQSKTSIEMDLAGSGLPADRIAMIKERMKSQMENTYVLSFDKTASIYKKEEKLDQAGGRGGMRFMFAGGAGSGNHYKNTQTKISAIESEFSGKNFLIKDELEPYDWKMEEETKMIGQNLCFKATTVIEMPVRETNFRMGRRGENSNESEEDNAPKMEPVIVTAWYTLDIPVNHGPGDYWGLPGLILEIISGNTVILCTKIVMNPKEKATISEPTKGKEVTQEEYDKIIQEKMKEMRERMGNERQRGNGRVQEIRIGG